MVAFIILLIFFQISDYVVIRSISWLGENYHGIRFIVNALFSTLGLAGLLYLIRIAANRKRLYLFFVTIFSFISILQLSYFSVYEKMVPPFGFGFFKENPVLSIQLYSENFPIIKSIILVFILSILFFFLKKSYKPTRTVKIISASVISLASISHSIFGWFSVPEFQHSTIAFFTSGTEAALHTASAFKVNRPEIPLKEFASDKNRPSIIWIIGESTTKSHMSVYGYERETTPFLDSLSKIDNKLFIYNNAITPGNKTNLVIPYLLTGLEGPDPHGRVYQTPTIFQYAKAAGYYTAFFSAQDFKWGKLEKILIDKNVDDYKDGSTLSPSVTVLKGADDMLLLNKRVRPWLDKATEPFLLVIQMDGSHYPYSEHCPPEHKRFLPEPSPNSHEAYDNSVVYTDMFLRELYQLFTIKHPDGWIFFAPDHGQSLSNGKSRYNDNYDEDVVEVPMLVFIPENSTTALQGNSINTSKVSTIDFFPTILDIIKIQPLYPIDGISLFNIVPQGRVRICSEYMPTFHNNPHAALFLPDNAVFKIDFTRQAACRIDTTGRDYFPVSRFSKEINEILKERTTAR